MKVYSKTSINPKESNSKGIKQFIALKNNKHGARKYQIEAYERLTTKLLEDDSRVAGMLVLPTGGGKTRVSISWAIDKAVNDGYKVLWIAHRHMLLEQAYETFIYFSGLCKVKDELNLKIVSGKSTHASLKDIDFKKDDIVVASIGSMHKKLRNKFRSVKKLLVIVDEAHHSVAPTYKEWVGLVDNKNKFGWFRQQLNENKFDKLKILGLTATPINSNEKKEDELKAIYDNQEALFAISTAELMKSGILSQPILNPISTESMVNIDVESIDGSTKKEKEVSINKLLANNIERNTHIVATYKKYYRDGKTLVFAVDTSHADMLKGMFNKEDVNCETIYSGKDYKEDVYKSNDEVIAEFREPKSGLDVLININILTEGSDIPTIQNLFITRVVGSETLYTQMIGRALRGVHSGGTKDANIVTFEDNIKNFDILSLKDLFAENGWEEDEIKEKSFKDIEVVNDRKYSINEIEDILEKEFTDETEDGEIKNIYRYNLIDSEYFRDERIKEKIDNDKQSMYLVGIRDLRAATKRWSFTKEQGQYSFKTNKKSDIKNFSRDKKLFYFIKQKQQILMPRTDQVLYWQEVYESFQKNHESSENVEMLPSYGMPMGEYKLYDDEDSLIDIIPVFKFQANSYERFLEAYYEKDLKSLNIDDIKEQYFSETYNFIPISDKILKSLITHIEHNERPMLDEYEFEKMNEADDIIDDIAKQLAMGKSYNLNSEYDNYKILHNFYSRKDFKSEVIAREDIIKGYSTEPDIIKEIPIEKLNLTRFNYVDSDDFNKIHDLDKLYIEASNEVCKQLKLKALKYSPEKAKWTKKAYKSYAGIARGIDSYTKTIYKEKASLEINSILCSKDIPSYVIEFVLYHEILHFELKMGHTKEFRRYEGLYPKYDEARKILSEVTDWVNAYWEDEKQVQKSNDFELHTVEKNTASEYSWELYNKDKKSNGTINKYINKKGVKLPTLKDMKKLYEDEEFRELLLKDDKQWFLCSDKKTSFCFGDGSNGVIDGFNFKKSGKKRTNNLHLLVMDES